jgi:hypothetical protein
MAFSVNQFRTNFQGDGARPNLFQISFGNLPSFVTGSLSSSITTPSTAVTGPTGGLGNNYLLSFMAKAAQLPGSSLGTVRVPYFGREIKLAGNRTFADWTITIINDENFAIRSAMENWMNGINSHVGNIRNSAAVSSTGLSGSSGGVSYVADSFVQQYRKDGTVATGGQYNFVGMFPIDISPIDVDWGTNDSIEEYSVTFSYQYWTNAISTDY